MLAFHFLQNPRTGNQKHISILETVPFAPQDAPRAQTSQINQSSLPGKICLPISQATDYIIIMCLNDYRWPIAMVYNASSFAQMVRTFYPINGMLFRLCENKIRDTMRPNLLF
jgi:hypothetical protein